MQLLNGRFHSQTSSARRQNEGFFKIGHLTSSFGIDSNQSELLPDFIEQNVNAKFHLDGHARVLRVCGQPIHIFNGNGVNLVVVVDALHIFDIALDGVNQILHIIVTVELNMRVVDLVLLHNHFDHFFVNFS